MDFYFGDVNDEGEDYKQAIVHVSIDSEFNVLRFDVDLLGLPEKPYQSHNVVVDFKVPNVHNNKTFYTDSNGLEMQKRILNYRPTWDLSEHFKFANDNTSLNYYPINSAISIKNEFTKANEGNLKFTVMNDRSQGGSSLEDGTIQLMQNRRIYGDDNKGMGEYLNERDPITHKGIRVPATYYVEVIDTNTTTSAQHLIHHKTDDPAQMFFAFDLVHAKTNAKKSGFSKAIKEAGVEGMVTYAIFPEAKNLVQIRIENLYDSYNSDSATKWVDINAVAEALWA